MTDIIRLMELAGMKDAARSNQKLQDIQEKSLKNWTQDHGFFTHDRGENIVAKDGSGDKYGYDGWLKSRITNNIYTLKIFPYGQSASRGADTSIWYVSFELKENGNNRGGEEDISGLSEATVDIVSEWASKNKPHELDTQPSNDPISNKVSGSLDDFCNRYNRSNRKQ